MGGSGLVFAAALLRVLLGATGGAAAADSSSVASAGGWSASPHEGQNLWVLVTLAPQYGQNRCVPRVAGVIPAPSPASGQSSVQAPAKTRGQSGPWRMAPSGY
jgi:hypothetical protein